MPKTFCVVGHDARQQAAAQVLRAAGLRVIGPEDACLADFALLPMSQERVSDEVARTLQGVRPGTLLLAGRPGSPIQAAARQAVRVVESGGRRIPENAGRSASVSRPDPGKLTSRELADIRKRVMDGEKISF